MVKPKNKNKKNQNEDFEDEVDLDPLGGNIEGQDPLPQAKQGSKKKKNKKKDDWEDDVASEIQALSLQSKGSGESEEEDTIPVKKKKEKKKKKKTDSDEEEEMGKKPKATFQMLMMEDDNDLPSESDHEDDVEVVLEKPKEEPKKEDTSKKDKKGKKGKKKGQEEEDLDALLAELDKPTEKSSKKKGKKKKGGEEEEAMETETKATENGNEEEMDLEAKSEVKVVSIDDIDDEEYDKKKRKKKGKKDEGKKSEKAEDEEEKVEDGEDKGEEGEDDEGGTMKTAAQKRKEKREREKLKKMQEKKKSKSKVESKESTEAGQEKQEKPEGEGEPTPEGEEGEKEGEKDEKKKKKKGEKDDKQKKKKAPVAAIKLMQQKLKEEEERLKQEEEERIRKEEEAIRLAEEKKRLEEERKQRKKQKEKDRIEKMKKEGTYLTKKEKQDKARAMQMLEQMKAAGIEVPSKEDAPRKRPVYDTRKKKKTQQKTEDEESSDKKSESPEEMTPEPEVKEVEEEKEAKPAKVEEEDDIKDDWAASSEEEEEEEEEKETIKNVEPKKVEIKVTDTKKAQKQEEDEEEEDEDEEEEDEEDEDDEEDDEEEEEEEETESEEESESEDEDMTPIERARARIMKRKEEAEKKRNLDNLRAAVICVLGHVDTGKTKILDKLRRTHVQDGEAGGITQQIGATNVPQSAIQEQTKMCKEFAKLELKLPGLLIIDTPGHESFSNLRSRGSSLCDLAILVVDIMHGLEPQTIESINLLKERKTPFIIALNKIDRLYQWKPMPHTDIVTTIKKQNPNTKSEFEARAQEVIVQMAEQSINAALFYENKNMREYVSLVPTSAHSGDGMGNLIALLCELAQTMMAKRLAYSEELQATVMEVKALPGLGTTLDIILVNGSIREGDQIIVPGTEGPIVTHIRGLLMPQPMKELRVKSNWEHHKEVKAAQGVKIIAKDLEKSLAGLPMYVAKKEDEVEYYKEELSAALKEVLNSIKLTERGVFVQASTLGSLEALLEFLRTSKIPYAGINIGPVHKRDIMKASVMLEHDSQYAVILAFDVRVEREAQEMADSLGVKIFTADIIYHLFDKFMAFRDEVKKKRQDEFRHIAVFPCKLRVLPQYVFNSRDPIVVGVSVEAGFVKIGTPLCVPSKEFIEIGRVVSIENNHKPIEKATRGMEVCIKVDAIPGEAPKMFGRHFDETDLLYSKISRQSIDAVKDHFREEMTKPDWQLVVEMKKLFQIL
ncbi:eukaryotic translation initiation factor 5B-like [Saccostrea echinata]|uniref:eukaryotic translation initiation factor 5B-like n=1 Tax=Saccostrea echinata TaxID=191078 RepID=UPI002A805E43|nr:eukaryotic translation initiation factor 5B-like [Saccostrea echinata]